MSVVTTTAETSPVEWLDLKFTTRTADDPQHIVNILYIAHLNKRAKLNIYCFVYMNLVGKDVPLDENVSWRKTGLKLGYWGHEGCRIGGGGEGYVGVWWGVWKFL